MKLVGYVRVSTHKQVDGGVSLDAQRAKISGYCDVYDHALVDVIEDAGASAKSLKREGLQAALALLAKGEADGMIVVKLDRVTRSVRDLGALIGKGGPFSKYALVSVGEQLDTSTAGGRMVLRLLTVVSEWEREVIGERVAAVHAYKRARGEYAGGKPPFGYRVADGLLVEDPGEQETIRLIRTLRADGLSLRAVVAELDRREIVGRTGRGLGLKQVARIAHATSQRAAICQSIGSRSTAPRRRIGSRLQT